MRLLFDAPNYIFNIDQRRDNVEVKGKGDLKTYWINCTTKIDLSGKKPTDAEYGTQLRNKNSSPRTDLYLETMHDFEATTGQE